MAKQSAVEPASENFSAVYDGMNITQLCKLFGMTFIYVRDRIERSGIKPAGRRGNADIYSIREVAPHLVKPKQSVEEYIKTMSPADLPKLITKEYWAGKRSKQEYELKAGMLWETVKVVEKVGELMKVFKMSALLMLDGVERQTELSERQRTIIRNLTHGMLDDCVQRIEANFVITEPTDIPPDEQLPEEVDDQGF